MIQKLKTSKIYGSHLIKLFAGFSIVGALVTAFSFFLLYFLINIVLLNVYFAYTTTYFISIAVSWFLNGKLVFNAALNVKNYLLYYGIYLSGMGLGLVIIVLSKQLFDYGDFLNSLLAMPFTMLWNFVGIQLIFSHSKEIPVIHE